MGRMKYKSGHSRIRSTSKIKNRSSAGVMAKAAMSREILAAGLAAAAAAITANPKSRKAIRAAGNDALDSAGDAAASVMMNATQLGTVIAEAVADAAQQVISRSGSTGKRGTRDCDTLDFEGAGMGELISHSDLQKHLQSIVDDENTDWASSELLGVSEAAERIGVARSTLDQWRRSNKVLAFSKGLRNFVFPIEQFQGSKPLPGLDKIRVYLGSDEEAWEWLVTPDRITENQKPIDLLREGRVDEVVRAAEGALDFA